MRYVDLEEQKINEHLSHLTTEILRGTLQILILLVIERKGLTHGYEIVNEILHDSGGVTTFKSTPSGGIEAKNGIKLKEGTIYPHLNKLNELGFLESRWDRNRKLYNLTPSGKEMLLRLKDLYQNLHSVVKKYLE